MLFRDTTQLHIQNINYRLSLSVSLKSDLPTGGETEDEKVRVDILENQAMDFRNGFVIMCYTDFVSTTLKVK